jgi:mono/diheme cytochrome c family protein
MSRAKLFFPPLTLGLILPFCFPAVAAPQKADDSAKAGAVLFRDKGCTYCHGPVGEGTKKAPAVTDLWKDKTWSNEKITTQILDGGQKMPPFRDSVSDDEVKDLIGWLRAKKKPVPPPADAQDATPTSGPQ